MEATLYFTLFASTLALMGWAVIGLPVGVVLGAMTLGETLRVRRLGPPDGEAGLEPTRFGRWALGTLLVVSGIVSIEYLFSGEVSTGEWAAAAQSAYHVLLALMAASAPVLLMAAMVLLVRARNDIRKHRRVADRPLAAAYALMIALQAGLFIIFDGPRYFGWF